MNDKQRQTLCAFYFKLIVTLIASIWIILWLLSHGHHSLTIRPNVSEYQSTAIDVQKLWYGVIATWLGLMIALAHFRGDAWIDSGHNDYPFPLTKVEFRSYANNMICLVTTACCAADFYILIYLMSVRAST